MMTSAGATRKTASQFLTKLVGGTAIVVLTILALAGVSPTSLMEIATVVVCVAAVFRRLTRNPEPAFVPARSRDSRGGP